MIFENGLIGPIWSRPEYVNIGDRTQILDPRSRHPTLYTNNNQPDVIALECYGYANTGKGGIGLATLVSN